jgi:hypothetical protein
VKERAAGGGGGGGQRVPHLIGCRGNQRSVHDPREGAHSYIGTSWSNQVGARNAIEGDRLRLFDFALLSPLNLRRRVCHELATTILLHSHREPLRFGTMRACTWRPYSHTQLRLCIKALSCNIDVLLIALNANENAPQFPCRYCRSARSEKGIKYHIAGFCGVPDKRLQ